MYDLCDCVLLNNKRFLAVPIVLNVSSVEIIVFPKFLTDEQADSGQHLNCCAALINSCYCWSVRQCRISKTNWRNLWTGTTTQFFWITRKKSSRLFPYQGEPIPPKFAKIRPRCLRNPAYRHTVHTERWNGKFPSSYTVLVSWRKYSNMRYTNRLKSLKRWQN